MVNTLKYQKELANLKSEHASLEDQISDLMRQKVIDQFEMQSLKKKKLLIKEQILHITEALSSDNSAA